MRIKHKIRGVRTLLRHYLGLGRVSPHTTQKDQQKQKEIGIVCERTSGREHEGHTPRQWKHQHRIPVVDQGGRVIGYRYLNGDEKK